MLKSISARLTPQQGRFAMKTAPLWHERGRPPSPAAHRMGRGASASARRPAPPGVGRRQYRRAADGDRGASLRRYSRHRAEVAGGGGDSSNRIDDLPTTFSGGMQQRLQIARNLVTHPKLVFMDEPTGGLDVSVQARLLDLLRGLVVELNLAVVIVTHDLGVARLLADRLLVMKQGQVVESGLTDRVLDDPHHPYTQLLVSSVLQN
ncbi:ATP-binding cassette domain-containing protein [Escherichia coli]|nr:ATP-binding cassette domain-containing protein [Escherichia coli]